MANSHRLLSLPQVEGASPPLIGARCATRGGTLRLLSSTHDTSVNVQERAPCSDLGGFTRLLSTPGGLPDGLTDEIPTIITKQLGSGQCDTCDHGFVVNRRAVLYLHPFLTPHASSTWGRSRGLKFLCIAALIAGDESAVVSQAAGSVSRVDFAHHGRVHFRDGDRSFVAQAAA